MRRVVLTATLLASIVLIPASAFAQAAIAGAVKDSSGAVLPGVSVEATSPSLIEKVRAAVTDGSGQYRIEDLRPGIYTVDLHAAGIQHVQAGRHRADRIVHGDDQRRLKVGSLAETITVTGETPIVDVQSAKARDHAEQRRAQGPSDRPQLQRPRGRRARRGHQH